MKKLISLLISVCLLLCLCASALAANPPVIDDANLFSPDEEAALESLIADFQQETGMDFVVVTTSFPHEESVVEVADTLYDQGGYGLGEDKSGALYYIDMYERLPHLSTCGAMIDYITDERGEAANDAAYSFLVNGDYAGAAQQMIYAVYGYVQEGIPEGQYQYDIITGQQLTARHKALTGSELLVCALIGLVAMLLFVKSVQGRYKLKGSTYEYAFRENADLTLTEQADDYLRTTTTRTRKADPPPPSSGRGAGGPRSGGSGVHTSHSGARHGGSTGRRF